LLLQAGTASTSAHANSRARMTDARLAIALPRERTDVSGCLLDPTFHA
jgi:hypothetical protein